MISKHRLINKEDWEDVMHIIDIICFQSDTILIERREELIKSLAEKLGMKLNRYDSYYEGKVEQDERRWLDFTNKEFIKLVDLIEFSSNSKLQNKFFKFGDKVE